MDIITIELVDKIEYERRNVKRAFDGVETHLKEIENGHALAINGFILDLKELAKSSQELLKKVETCIKNP